MTIYFFQQMKWIPIFHQMTEIREKLDSIYKVDNQWKYRPRKEGFKIYAAKNLLSPELFFFANNFATDTSRQISQKKFQKKKIRSKVK